MPLYAWLDKKTEKKVEVLRSFVDYEIPPAREEAGDMSNEEFRDADWERQIYGTQRVIKGDSWGPGKGYW